MNAGKWIEGIDSQEKTLDNLKMSFCTILARLSVNDITFKATPRLWLATLVELYAHENIERGYRPSIAVRKENDVAFFYEILGDVVKEINDNTKIEKFIQALCLHELIHIVLDHGVDTEEERQIAEEEVYSWMAGYAPEYLRVWVNYMIPTEKICETHKKK